MPREAEDQNLFCYGNREVIFTNLLKCDAKPCNWLCIKEYMILLDFKLVLWL